MAVSTGAAILGSAAIGALANRGQGSSQSTYQQMQVDPASQYETGAVSGIQNAYSQLQQFTNAGPGLQDVQGGYQAQNDLASMLKSYSQGGYAPTAQDQQYAQQMTAPQQEAIRQSGIQQNQQFRQTAAQTGRGPMDFAFQNKLGQNLSNMQMGLAAQQSQIAAQQPNQRLGYAQDYASLKQGLASQAMANRQAIAGLGASIRDSERNLRLSSAGRSVMQSSPAGDQTSNMLQGALAGAGTGMSLMNQFGGGGQQAASPWTGVSASPQLANTVNYGMNSIGSGFKMSSPGALAAPAIYGSQPSMSSVPSFLNPATAYQSQPQQTNLFQGIPGFGR